MIKLILATVCMLLSVSIYTQTDVILKKEYQSMNYGVKFPLEQMSRDSMANTHEIKMYHDTFPSIKKYKMGNMPRSKHVMMSNGKMIMMKNGKTTILKNYTDLNNGTRAMHDGNIIKKDGFIWTLQEGECINMAGEVMVMPNQ